MDRLEPGSRLRVLVVDDEARARGALTALLETYPGIEVVGEASDGEHAVELAGTLTPDVVVMDGIMPRLDGPGAAHRIKQRVPRVAVLMLSLYGDLEWDARRLGADGFLVKSASGEEIVELITVLGRRASAGRSTTTNQREQGVTP
jgi:DNA-binding NarL/FixJ family response regulator